MASEDHLYLTMPSSASLDLYLDNKMSYFKTELLNTIELNHEKYEVGLTEIVLDADIENVPHHRVAFTIFRSADFVKQKFQEADFKDLTTVKIGSKDYYSETFYIVRGLYKYLTAILRFFNKYLLKSKICYDLVFSVQKIPEETAEIVSLSSALSLNLRDTDIFYFHPSAWLREGIHSMAFNEDGYFRFNGDTFVHGLRRYIPTITEFSMNTARSIYFICEPDHLLQDPGMAYVYTDNIDYQHVGDTKASLLRVVKFFKDKRIVTFPYVHYLPLNKTYLKSIRIYIRDVEGNPYPFTKGTAVCKVHIRRKLR